MPFLDVGETDENCASEIKEPLAQVM